MLDNIFLYYIITITTLSFLCLYRAYKGPSPADRVVAINVILTKVVIILCVMTVVFNTPFYIDIAIVYALIGFIATIVLAKLITTKKLSRGADDV